jgi:hypothetical protein
VPGSRLVEVTSGLLYENEKSGFRRGSTDSFTRTHDPCATHIVLRERGALSEPSFDAEWVVDGA